MSLVFFLARCLRVHTRDVYRVYMMGEHHKFEGKVFESFGKTQF